MNRPFVQNEPDPATLRYGVDYARIIQEPRLKLPGLLASARLGDKNPTGGPSAHIARTALSQYLPLVHDDYMSASLGLIEIGSAEQHGERLIADKLSNDIPELATRKRIDADGWLVQQQEFRRANQGASKPQLLLHPPR
jgi:hypothetical protein